jgi:hypothetical protein
MNAGKTGGLPAPLERVRRRFAEWRRTRRAPSRIPCALWAAAVKMAGKYGVCRTARALPVEYYSLKKRVEQQSLAARGKRKPGSEITFVEFSCPPATGLATVPIGECDCTLELEDTAGSKMRVHLKAAAPPDLTALCRSFWNPAP